MNEKHIPEIIGVSQHIKNIHKQVKSAAKKDMTVLIQGPTGTGKELIAKNIHYSSERKNKPFEIVNCGAIPSELFESQFFGYEKGAFTGALNKKAGIAERADKGTLFLYEIGDLRLDHQVKILRFLEDGRYRTVGGTETKKVDVRVIAATNKDLRTAIREENFREDLYYRLGDYIIYTEPLSKRPEDIICLVYHFTGIKESKIDPIKKFLLYSYNFPGNVRELKTLLSHDNEYTKQELKRAIAEETGINYEEISKFSNGGIIANYTFEQEESKSLHDNLAILEAVLVVDDSSLDIKKIVEAYEIVVLIHRSQLNKTAIVETLHKRKSKITPREFKRAFGFDLPQKGFDENFEEPNRAYRIYPHFFGYWREQTNRFLKHKGLSELHKKLSHHFLE